MFKRKTLSCSFCGKTEDEVAKLAAGPNVFICDTCAAEAHRIMSDPTIGPGVPRAPRTGLLDRLRSWVKDNQTSRGLAHP